MTTNKDTAIPDSKVADLVEAMGAQLITSVRQGQQRSVGATKRLINNVASVAKPDLSQIPDLPGFSTVAAAATYPLDVAAELLEAQRAFIGGLPGAFLPATSR